MTQKIPTRQIHELDKKLKFLKTNDIARKHCRHDGTMASFSQNLGISENTLNDCMKPHRLRVNAENEAVIARKCGFEVKWREWCDVSDGRPPNKGPYDPPRMDAVEQFERRYKDAQTQYRDAGKRVSPTSESDNVFEFLDCGTITSLRIKDQPVIGNPIVVDYELDYEAIMSTSLDRCQIVKDDFQKILAHQVRTHRSLLLYDYETTPCPLPGGMTVFLSKRGFRINLEWLARTQVDSSLDEHWEALCKSYFSATRLRYRSDHNLLLKASVRREVLDIMAQLVTSANGYFFLVNRIDSSQIDSEILARKRGAEQSIQEADKSADTIEGDTANSYTHLGRLAIYLDMTLSNVHKLIIAFASRLKF
jgi:hypothetical protein